MPGFAHRSTNSVLMPGVEAKFDSMIYTYFEKLEEKNCA